MHLDNFRVVPTFDQTLQDDILVIVRMRFTQNNQQIATCQRTRRSHSDKARRTTPVGHRVGQHQIGVATAPYLPNYVSDRQDRPFLRPSWTSNDFSTWISHFTRRQSSVCCCCCCVMGCLCVGFGLGAGVFPLGRCCSCCKMMTCDLIQTTYSMMEDVTL